MQRQSSIAAWCERIIEGGWLLALVLIPSYFNLLTSRHFEPDKATSLRAIVLIMAAAGLIRVLELGGRRTAGAAAGSWWRRFTIVPLALPTVLYALVFIITTITSVVPGTSFWGSYQRLQGTYTNLSYMGLATIIVLTLRRREQLERLITVAVLGSLPAIGYGLVQHYQIDPLPWKGDVISRVASTMGNSIFVAAYLLMLVPFALYRAITAFADARRAAEPGDSSDFGWGAAYALLAIGSLLLLMAVTKFGAVVRSFDATTNIPDLRYWWIFLFALIVTCGLYILPTLRPHTADRITIGMLWPGILAVAFVLLLGLSYMVGQASGTQVVQSRAGRDDSDWPFWLLGGLVFVIGTYGLFFTLPRRAVPSRRLLQLQGVGMLIIAFLQLLTIFYTQSRGPWIGVAAALFIFFTLLLWRAFRHARAGEQSQAGLYRNLLIGWVALALLLGGFLAAFNLSDAPMFQSLRRVPYIGRMGTLLETESGTGLVRTLIWRGDDKAGGALALITSNPLRTVIGWGPESMFVAYNKFYPPSLANIEARGASPDRSHEAYLDELVTKGVLGLASYLFVIISLLVLAWRLMQRVGDWRTQVLAIAGIAIVAGHSVEGLTGIPIVSTLMMLWVTLAVVVSAGALAGQYSIGADEPAQVPEPAEVAAPVPAKAQPARSGNRRQGAVARGASQARAARGRASSSGGNSLQWLLYGIIAVFTLWAVWSFNADNVFADMRFQQGQILSDNPNSGYEQQLLGMGYYLDAIRMEPRQDFYYLNLGRSLMSLADLKRQQANGQFGQPKPNANINDLLDMSDDQAAEQAVLQQTPLETMSYAEAVLTRAQQLNSLNKDHYANLARMHNFWFSRFGQDPQQLNDAIDWYKRGHEIAPQDVTILNEYASAVALMGNYLTNQQKAAEAAPYYQQASDLFAQSKVLDPNYPDTALRQAELLRLQGNIAQAVDSYLALLKANSHAIDNQVSLLADSLRSQPDQLTRLRDAYASAAQQNPNDATLQSFIGLLSVRLNDMPRAATAFARWTELQPESLDARRNYTLVLSETQQYAQAVTQAQGLLALAQKQRVAQDQLTLYQNLVSFFTAKAQGG